MCVFSHTIVYLELNLSLMKQDERAKREREKAKWTSVMDEIANLKIRVRSPIHELYLHSLTTNTHR